MKIYTKTGDDGSTGLFGGGRVSKMSARIGAYGTVDELNSLIGVVRSLDGAKAFGDFFERLQNELFVLGADLATPSGSTASPLRVDPNSIEWLEGEIDKATAELPPLKNFILPGGTLLSGHLHLARTVCRRAERLVVQVQEEEMTRLSDPIKYLNRLSDLLFVLARQANLLAGVEDTEWKPQK